MEHTFTADQIAIACSDAGLSDSQCESLLITLHYTPAAAPAVQVQDERAAFIEWMREADNVPDFVPDNTIMAGEISKHQFAAWQASAALASQASKGAGTNLNLTADETTAVLAWLEIHRSGAAQAQPVASKSALQRYNEHMEGCEEPSALERLRFFASLAMTNGTDWTDSEKFFDDVEAQIGAQPVADAAPRRFNWTLDGMEQAADGAYCYVSALAAKPAE